MSVRRALHMAAILFVLGSAIPLAADPPRQVGRLGLIAGAVSFRTANLDQWVPATLNYPLTAGCRLWSDRNGRAEIQVASAAVRLDSLTDFSFINLDDQVVQIGLVQGSLGVTLWSADPGDVFEIDTYNTSVSLVSEGSYRIDVLPNGDTTIIVRRGMAQVVVGNVTLVVLQGQSATLAGYGSLTCRVGDVPGLDDWDRWCAALDARRENPPALRYTSRGMVGVQDLDEYGTWITVAPYGPVWMPLSLPAGWAPYHFGHWAWVDPWGWTWIDDAPWGFAPFHYGRWALMSGRWCWVPGVAVVRPVYAPALVVFIGGAGWGPGGDGIGWFPLGPDEIYLPSYSTGDSYVVSINQPAVPRVTVESVRSARKEKTDYVNRAHPQSVTIVSRESFVQSRPTSSSILSVPAAEIRKAPVTGMTAAEPPQRESRAGTELKSWTSVPQPSPELEGRTVISRPSSQPRQQEQPASGRQEKAAQQPGRGPQDTGGQREAASALVAAGRESLSALQQRLESVRKTGGLAFDFNAAFQQLAITQRLLDDADKACQAGNYAQASEMAAEAQSQIEDLDTQLSAALNGIKGRQGNGGQKSSIQQSSPQGGSKR